MGERVVFFRVFFSRLTPTSPLFSHRVPAPRAPQIVVNYSIDDIGHISFYLAPKIEDEDAATME